MLEKNTAISDLINEMRRKNTELLKILIAEGQEMGVFKKGADIILLMNTLTGTVTQSLINQNYYRKYNHLEHLNDDAFQQQLNNKLSSYIKDLFKSILSYEV